MLLCKEASAPLTRAKANGLREEEAQEEEKKNCQPTRDKRRRFVCPWPSLRAASARARAQTRIGQPDRPAKGLRSPPEVAKGVGGGEIRSSGQRRAQKMMNLVGARKGNRKPDWHRRGGIVLHKAKANCAQQIQSQFQKLSSTQKPMPVAKVKQLSSFRLAQASKQALKHTSCQRKLACFGAKRARISILKEQSSHFVAGTSFCKPKHHD